LTWVLGWFPAWLFGVGVLTPTLAKTLEATSWAPPGSAPAMARPVVRLSTPTTVPAATLAERSLVRTGDLRRLVGWVDATTAAIVGTASDSPTIAERRGKNKARVAVARKLLTLVYYGLRDGEIRCLRDNEAVAA
jgi:hypothetical protein